MSYIEQKGSAGIKFVNFSFTEGKLGGVAEDQEWEKTFH